MGNFSEFAIYDAGRFRVALNGFSSSCGNWFHPDNS
jgi:hypothetical protein